MSKQLQLQFEANQEHQLTAIESIIRLFEGLPKRPPEFSLGGEIVPNLPPTSASGSTELAEVSVESHESLHETWLRDNLLAVQEKNGIQNPLAELEMDEGLVLEGAGSETWRYPHFTIEMETGTGKTYVYLRTIYELRQRYGFSKFIIVVPSIAIYEGVLKNLDITRAHFRSLYGNELVIPVPYDGSKLSRLREFATSTFTMVMVMTIDAFIRIGNNIYKHSEKLPGERKPYQFIQETRPILILDEPQSIISLQSAKAEEALRTLHPLLALRYSATHRTSPNLVYRLTPFEAFRRNLVKKIQVCDVYERDNFNQPFLALNSISRNGRITARVMTYVNEKGQTREKEVALHHNEDLYQKTQREEHKAGYRVAEINAAENFVLFENCLKLKLNETIGPSRPEIFRLQIEETIKTHMQRQKELRRKNIKVLSLFFIDRVANYTDENGLIKRLFDDAFNQLKADFPFFKKFQAEQVRKAYFAEMKTKSGEKKALDTENRSVEREMEKEAFELIMRDKERLLSFDEPVCFIFAHSALKEGWDNPNVFQICTLNQAVSEIKKRQEIGRGLRLCVNQEGLRLFDDELNVLTVIANESYSSYAANLQQEYVTAGMAAPPPPAHAKREWAKRRDKIFRGDQRFKEFWEKLSQQVTYRVNADTARLIEECVTKLNAQPFPEPVLVVEKGKFVVTRFVIKLEYVNGDSAKLVVEISDNSGKSKTRSIVVKKRDRLAQLLRDERLRPYQIVEMHGSGKNGKIIFANGEELFSDGTLSFESEAGQKPHEVTIHRRELIYPVFNLLDRAARETGLTRPTLNKIFKGLQESHKRMIFRNPEGFTSHFIAEIKQALADHVAERIEFVPEDGNDQHDLEDLFPPKKLFPQKQLIETDDHGLYDLIQTDSQVEEKFVARLKSDKEKMIFYFKFPAAFRIKLPRVIGNYNPDWGIVRYADDGGFILQLVRETKFRNENELRFPHEQRKIKCARKHFQAMHIDYRPIFPDFAEWWRPEQKASA